MKEQRGFTIIEVMIALAVAGLILMMVMMMFPALIRNGHNNQRKQDVTSILSSVSHYQLTHSGSFPHTFSDLTGTKLTMYDSANVNLHSNLPSASRTLDNSNIPSDESVEVQNSLVCDNDNNLATGQGASSRNVVALYRIEAAGGFAFKCQDL